LEKCSTSSLIEAGIGVGADNILGYAMSFLPEFPQIRAKNLKNKLSPYKFSVAVSMPTLCFPLSFCYRLENKKIYT